MLSCARFSPRIVTNLNTNITKPFVFNMPRGLGVLLILQLFSIVVYSCMFMSVSPLSRTLFHISQTKLAALALGFIALNFALHALAGILSGRFFSFRIVLATGLICGLIGICLLSIDSINAFYWSLTFVIFGSGLSLTAVNCLVTQLFKPEDKRRETAFLWIYAIMNLGFMAGFAIAAFFDQHLHFHQLATTCACCTLLALVVLQVNWRKLDDRLTLLQTYPRPQLLSHYIFGVVLCLLSLSLVRILLNHPEFSAHLVALVGAGILVLIFFIAFKQPSQQTRNRIFAFVILSIIAIIFWSINLLLPMGLNSIMQASTHFQVLGVKVSQTIIDSANTFVIIVVAPLLGFLFYHFRYKGMTLKIPVKFAIGLVIAALSLLVLPLTLQHTAVVNASHHTAFILSYCLQGLAELFIQPIGMAMIGQLAPISLQGVFMGFWMMTLGIASLCSSMFEHWIRGTQQNLPAIDTTQHIIHAFKLLGWVTIGLAIIVILLNPWLKKMINYRSLDPSLHKS